MNTQYISGLGLKEGIRADNTYISRLPVVKNLQRQKTLLFKENVTFFVGENGTGKSTLLEAIAIAYGFNPEGGSINFSFSSQDTHADLSQYLILRKGIHKPQDGFFLRAESFYNVATYIDQLEQESGGLLPSYGGVSLHHQSHGESFLSLVLNRFGGNGLYILDEPEAALSPTRQMTLLAQINILVQQNCQFIIATHSPILLSYPQAEIWQLTDKELALTAYEETENYLVTKQFLNNPQKMLKYLLDDC